jgi:hypothetical protein
VTLGTETRTSEPWRPAKARGRNLDPGVRLDDTDNAAAVGEEVAGATARR